LHVAFSLAAYTLTESWLALAVGMLLFSGDAMYSYVYERRLSTLRVHAGYTGRIKQTETSVYERGTRFSALTRSQQVRTVTGQLKQYKSIYPMIALSYVSPITLVAGLGALGAYKHWRWIRLVGRALGEVRAAGSERQEDTETQRPVAAARGAR
jgi:hypothetical protein